MRKIGLSIVDLGNFVEFSTMMTLSLPISSVYGKAKPQRKFGRKERLLHNFWGGVCTKFQLKCAFTHATDSTFYQSWPKKLGTNISYTCSLIGRGEKRLDQRIV